MLHCDLQELKTRIGTMLENVRQMLPEEGADEVDQDPGAGDGE